MFKKIISRIRQRRKDPKVWLHTITRDMDVDWGYIDEITELRKSQLPEEAVHITGRKDQWAIVDMEPEIPEYLDPDAETDENGDYIVKHSYFDGRGYFCYYHDDRIRKGYDSLGRLERKPMEWQKLLIIAVAVIVGAWMVMRMI